MTRLLIHVEGLTEETFVNQVLAPHLYHFGYSNVSARLLGNARMRSRRGGIKSWHAVRDDILNHLRGDVGSISTIMVDYYALPENGNKAWPNRNLTTGLAFENKASSIEEAIHAEICDSMGGGFNNGRFIPYIVMHEFEALLFSDPDNFAKGIGHTNLAERFHEIKNDFHSPEEINDSPQTAPSKRVVGVFPNYDKPLMGTLAVLEIGLDTIRQECKLFNDWLTLLENSCNG